MLFSKTDEFKDGDIALVKNVLEKMIGKGPETCQDISLENDFIFLDSWDNKMGFVKESDGSYTILSLKFKNGICSFYQIIKKEEGKKWSQSTFYDFSSVRDKGIIVDQE